MKTAKKLTPPPVDTRKELFVEETSSCVRDYRENVEFGSWEQRYDNSVVKVSRDSELLNRYNFTACKVPDVVYNASYVYIVVVTYSTGDTFGNSSGNLAIAFITENPEEALKAKEVIETVEDGWTEEWCEHPKSVASYPRWQGYFERVESVDIVFLPVMG